MDLSFLPHRIRPYLSSKFRTIEWGPNGVVMLDQRLLPAQELYLELTTPEEVGRAIRDLVIRGAPAIGIAAAMGLALAARQERVSTAPELLDRLGHHARVLLSTRPTAVNLRWALKRCLDLAAGSVDEGPDRIREILVREAQKILMEDVMANVAMGEAGASLVPHGARILTHCNAGALATGGYGTALGVVRSAHSQGKVVRVLADETRPFLQGARLTAWELAKDDIPVTVITDNMAGYFMKNRNVDLVIVGADRIASNGDVANKIGTYSLAVLAKEHAIPFYVAAPISTLDPCLRSGDDIPIEERDPEEVLWWAGTRLAPHGVSARYPAFDVTPASLVSAIITEHGVLLPPFEESLSQALQREKAGKKPGTRN